MEPKRVADRYRLLDLLGRGPMSEVWLAEDDELGRDVALKLIASTADRARFEREAHAAAALAHENVIQLYDFGESEGRPFMVLEYLRGGTLEDRLKPGRPLGDAEAERIAKELAAGLAHAHARGLVHRDLKPTNVLFDEEGRAKIADFGIARLEYGGTLTDTGTILGTAAYISPEQAAGRRGTTASDVYAFGVVLFRMLTGRLPFEATQPVDLLAMHRDRDAPRVADVRGAAPSALASLADDALARAPEARPRDGQELVRRLASSPTTPAPRPPSSEAPTRVIGHPRERRILFPALLATVALAAAGAGAAYVVTRSSGGNSAPPLPPAPERATFARTSTTERVSTAGVVSEPSTAAATSSRTSSTARQTSTQAPVFGTTTIEFTTPPPPPPPTDTTLTTVDTTDTTGITGAVDTTGTTGGAAG